MKRRFFLILTLVLLLLTTTVSVFAASSVNISLSANSKSVSRGGKVTITVSASVDSCGSGGVEVSYDSNVFELESGKWQLSAFMSDFSTSSRDGVFAMESARGISGKVFQFTLRAKGDAGFGNSNVTVKFNADRKSVSKSISIMVACDHKYSNSCDTDCNVCGATRKINHSWNNGDVLKEATCKATGSAKYTCTVCKETKTGKLEKTAHTYDHACDTDCNVCGEVREITHALSWTCSTTEHWQACSVCGYEQDRGVHTLDSKVTGVAEGHGILCTTCNLIPDMKAHTLDSRCDEECADCGYQRAVTHYYGVTWHYDITGHWQACILCGKKTEVQAHVTGHEVAEPQVVDPEGTVPETTEPVATEPEVKEETDIMCTTCGFIVTPAPDHVHVMGGDWISDETGHRYPCRCGAESDMMPHIWDAGTIDEVAGIVMYHCTDCGYARAEIYIPEPTTVVERILAIVPLWMILAGGLGVSVIVNIILAASMGAKKRMATKSGRFLKQEEPVE